MCKVNKYLVFARIKNRIYKHAMQSLCNNLKLRLDQMLQFKNENLLHLKKWQFQEQFLLLRKEVMILNGNAICLSNHNKVGEFPHISDRNHSLLFKLQFKLIIN